MCSAIGGNADQPGGYMYVEGGSISATSNGMAAGIGGGMGGSYTGRQWGCDLTVNRGTVTATSTGGGAGIGCGAGAAADGGFLEINGGTVTARATYRTGDGIGGDGIDNACLELIRINGGTLIASSSPETTNTKAMVDERIEIADQIQVRAGYDAGSATLAVVTANSDGRRGACAQNYAKATVCDHAGHDPYYPVSAASHTFDCSACKAVIGEEPHDFSKFGRICSLCGISKYVQIALEPGEAGGQAQAFFVDHGTYELPDCTFSAPARKVFGGWAYGDPAVILQPGDPIDLPLTEGVTLTALWKYPDLVVDGVTYTAWADNKTLPSTPGCWYLLDEVDRMTDCWTVPQGNTILNLNGNHIWRGAIASEIWSAEDQPLTVVTGITDYAGGIVCHKPIYLSAVYPDGILRMIVRPAFGTPDLTLPAGPVAIEANAFEGVALVTVVDAHTCTAIGPEAFKNCAGLTQILLPADCLIDSAAFTGCSGPVFVFAPAGGDTEASCAAIPACVFIGQ